MTMAKVVAVAEAVMAVTSAMPAVAAVPTMAVSASERRSRDGQRGSGQRDSRNRKEFLGPRHDRLMIWQATIALL